MTKRRVIKELAITEASLAMWLRDPMCQPWCNEYVIYTSGDRVRIDCACNARTMRRTREIPRGVNARADAQEWAEWLEQPGISYDPVTVIRQGRRDLRDGQQ